MAASQMRVKRSNNNNNSKRATVGQRIMQKQRVAWLTGFCEITKYGFCEIKKIWILQNKDLDFAKSTFFTLIKSGFCEMKKNIWILRNEPIAATYCLLQINLKKSYDVMERSDNKKSLHSRGLFSLSENEVASL